MEARSCRAGANWVNVCRVNVIEGEPNDRQMTTGNHTVRDIYCCKCGTILGWKYVSIPIPIYFHFRFSAHEPLPLVRRTRRTNNPKSTRKGSTSWSATSSSMSNSRVELQHARNLRRPSRSTLRLFLATTLLTSLVSRFFFRDVRRNIAAPPSHKQHSSNLASASLHPHVDIESSLHSHTSPHHFTTSPPVIVPRRQSPTGGSPTSHVNWCPFVSGGTRPVPLDVGMGRASIPPICRETRGGQGRADTSCLHHGTSNFWRRGDSLIK